MSMLDDIILSDSLRYEHHTLIADIPSDDPIRIEGALNDICHHNILLIDLAYDLLVRYMNYLVIERYCAHIWEYIKWENPFSSWLIKAVYEESIRQVMLHINWLEPAVVTALPTPQQLANPKVRQILFPDNITPLPNPNARNKYTLTSSYIADRCQYDEAFLQYYPNNDLITFSQQLTYIFGWLVDANSLGKNINRAAKKLPILKKNHKK